MLTGGEYRSVVYIVSYKSIKVHSKLSTSKRRMKYFVC